MYLSLSALVYLPVDSVILETYKREDKHTAYAEEEHDTQLHRSDTWFPSSCNVVNVRNVSLLHEKSHMLREK